MEWEPEYEPEKVPPATREPRTERMMRMVIVVVRTAAMLSCKLRVNDMLESGRDRNYLVTMVLTASSVPVGVMMNQNKTLAMLTIQMDYCESLNQGKGVKERRGTNTVEIEAITEHQFPETERLDLQRLDRAKEGKTELGIARERRLAEIGKSG